MGDDKDTALVTTRALPSALQPRARAAATTSAAQVYLARLAPGSRPSMRSALEIVARALNATDPLTVPWGQLRYEHAQAIRAKLASTYAPATANRILSALRGVLKEAWRLGGMAAEDYQRAVDIDRVQGSREAPGRAIPQLEMGKLMRVALDQGGARGERDCAMLALLYGAGMRRVEIARADRERLNISAKILVVIGKGNKERSIPLAPAVAAHVKNWLEHRGEMPGPLFTPLGKDDSVHIARLTPDGISYIVNTLARSANVELTTHDFRRTFISDALGRGMDLVTVGGVVGHANPATTAKYDRRGFEAKQRAVADVKIPFAPRSED